MYFVHSLSLRQYSFINIRKLSECFTAKKAGSIDINLECTPPVVQSFFLYIVKWGNYELKTPKGCNF